MTGEVAGLFPKDEMDNLLNDVRSIFKKESPGETCSNLMNKFVERHAVHLQKGELWGEVQQPVD